MSSNTKPEDMDIAKDSNEGIETNGGKSKTPKRKGTGDKPGGIKKRKKTPAEMDLRLKKYVHPKNALMCLNELMQGAPLKFEQDETSSTTLGAQICMTIEVNGQKYKGFGSSKLSAKQAAAEAALVSFVKPPTASDEDDKTPWGVLASFAMYKLFNEWKEGRIGMNSSTAPAASFGAPMVPDPTSAKTLQSMLSNIQGEGDGKGGSATAGSGTPKGKSDGKGKKPKEKKENDGPKKIPAPAKAVLENAASMNPVMLLHQMRPTTSYDQSCALKGEHQEFTLKCVIDGKSFAGVGGTVKKAKYDLAVKANKALFNVNTVYTGAK